MQENNIINIKYKNQQINDKQQYKQQNLPKYVNWSEKGYVNPIQDQGVCGSSWAFAAVSQLESLYAIKNQNLIKLSEQQLISCAPLPNLGCLGGNSLYAFEYTKKHGIMLELDYPYAQKSSNTFCLNFGQFS
ncbi:hypothetical protein PPERSA_09245 [Pseudocohnilembus persalinus]|uniref:Peptidase C1A papain C-terminal domain-containing protein n=1 Tax=Pseudocohnilembus persalinus TaxID=266149 RepID=A0A0V0QMF0_PSEPJ|nr:hypothetical protein PPERSA_09245 [Pseudocohnilembus persalinus]|eukprot:KRX03233.1 hypothetical protein PPERSA_09245 [Pseudocohnilembus persalinus]